MANWKKLIYSGSDAQLRHVTASGAGQFGNDITITSGSVNIETFNEGVQFYNGNNYSNKIKLTTAENLQYIAAGSHQFAAQSVQILNGKALIFEDINNTDSIRLRNNVAANVSGARLDFTDESYTAIMSVTSSGKVGIGTITPNEKLSVDGNIELTTGADRRIYMGGQSGTTFGIAYNSEYPDYGIFYTEGSHDKVNISPNGSATAGVMTLVGDGNVGIGTTAPAAKLHIKEQVASTSQIRMSAASNEANYGYLTMLDNTTNTAKLTFGTTYGYNTPVDAMTIFNGNVGIGTTNPANKLHVSGTSNQTVHIESPTQDAKVGILLDSLRAGSNTMGASHLYKQDSNTYLDSDESFYIRPNNRTGFVIAGNSDIQFISSSDNDTVQTSYFHADSQTQRIGIGTDTPSKALTVEGDISASGDLYTRHAYVSGTLSIEGFADVNNTLAALTAQDNAITADTASTINVTNMSDDHNSAYYITAVNSIDDGQNLKGQDLLRWNPSSSTLTVQNNDGNKIAGIDIRGTVEGTGRLYVGQDASYGGGIIYQGDATPARIPHTPGNDWTGLFRRNAGINAFVAGYKYNSDNFYFSGSVGIGPSSPGAKLHVKTTSLNTVALFESPNDKALIRIKDDNTDVHLIAKDNLLSISSNTTDYSKFNVNISNGNVGIGTVAPPKKLTVEGDISASATMYGQELTIEPGSAHSTYDKLANFHGGRLVIAKKSNAVFLQPGAGGNEFEITDTASGNGSKGNVLLRVSGDHAYDKTLQLAVDAGTKVGIGTALPATELDLHGKLSINSHKVLDLSNSNLSRGPFNPIVAAIRNSGKCLRLDTDFADGVNGVGVYNNAGGNVVTITRFKWNLDLGDPLNFDADQGNNWANILHEGNGETNLDSLGVPNSSGYVLRITNDGTGDAVTVTPGLGGFAQTYRNPNSVTSVANQMNHTYVQIFKALVPVNYELVIQENHQGTDKTSYFLTNNKGTGKWEWYARVNHVGSSTTGTYDSAGHVYIRRQNNVISYDAVTWFLASCTVYDVTEADAFTHRRIGVGTISPGSELEVIGDISASGNISSNTITASNVQIEEDLTLEGDLGIAGSIFGLTGFGVTIDDVAITSGSTNFGSGSLPSEVSHTRTGSMHITGSDLTWNGETVLTDSDVYWANTGTELTSSKSVGISGSLRVLGPITASSLSIAPDGTDIINFGLSSSYAGTDDVYNYFPILRIGSTTDSFIGHGQALDALGTPRNRIKFENSSNTIYVGNTVSQVSIEDSDVANSAVAINSRDFVIRNYYGATDIPSILQITESRANFSGDVQISASLYISQSVTARSFTGSLLGNVEGTASYAVTASYALNSIDAFPFTGHAIITGSLEFDSQALPLNDLTDANHSSYITSTSPLEEDDWNAFDGDTGTYYTVNAAQSENSPTLDYNINEKLGYAPIVTAYYISFRIANRTHTKLELYGSNDGTSWQLIHTDPDNAFSLDQLRRKVSITNVKSFKHIRMRFPDGYQGSEGIAVTGIQYFAEGIVTAGYFEGTGSYSLFAETGSHAITSVSASHAITSSYALTASYADIAKFANNSAQWHDKGTELTSSADVGISGSLQVHGDIIAETLQIRPDFPAATPVIEFEVSSSGIDAAFNLFPMLNFGGASAYIGHKGNVNDFGFTKNGIKFDIEGPHDLVLGGPGSSITIKNETNPAAASIAFKGYHDMQFGTSDDANIMFLTKSYAEINDARITGSLYGTGSWAYNAVSASWAPTADAQWYEDSIGGIPYLSSSKAVKIKNTLHVYSSGDTATDPLEGHLLRVTNTTNGDPIVEHFFAQEDNLQKGFRWVMDGTTNNDFSLYRHDTSVAGSQVFKVQRGSDNVHFLGSISASANAGTDHTFGGNFTLTNVFSHGDTVLTIEADSNNNDGTFVSGVSENSNPYIHLKQDGAAIAGMIGISGEQHQWPDGSTLSGSLANGMVIGMTGAATSQNRALTLAAGNSASLQIKNNADVHILKGDLFVDAMTETTTHNDAIMTVVYDSGSGQLMYTGSYGGGGSVDSFNGGVIDNALFIEQYIYHTQTAAEAAYFGFSDEDQFSVGLNSTEKLRLQSNGELHITDDIIAFSTTPSDQRLKTNIQLLTGSLDTICNLEGVRYDWKHRNTGTQLGVIAQQVERYVPEIVKEMELPLHAPDDTKYKTVKYEQLVPHLIEAIKELRSELNEVKRQLKE